MKINPVIEARISMKDLYPHLGIISLIGFAIIIIIHLLTFLGIGLFVMTSQLSIVMFIGAFAVFVSMVFAAMQLNLDYRSPEAHQNNWRKILAPIPIWGQRLITICGVYATINFFLIPIVSPIGPGNVIDRGGKYFLETETKVVRELSMEEYHQHQIYMTRSWSGHLMIFYLLPGLFFLYHTPSRRRRR